MFLTSVVKMPSRERQRRAKRREEYIQNRDGELETSRVREPRFYLKRGGGGGGGGGGGACML